MRVSNIFQAIEGQQVECETGVSAPVRIDMSYPSNYNDWGGGDPPPGLDVLSSELNRMKGKYTAEHYQRTWLPEQYRLSPPDPSYYQSTQFRHPTRLSTSQFQQQYTLACTNIFISPPLIDWDTHVPIIKQNRIGLSPQSSPFSIYIYKNVTASLTASSWGP
jgi:hypothetical protein